MPDQDYRVYYLGHSAWAVETERHRLLFDCQDENIKPGALTDGLVDISQLTDKPLYMFFSHRHHDHYSPKLHALSTGYAQVYTVLGDFTSPVAHNTTVMRPRESRVFGALTVNTAASTDEGVCFLIQADGLALFFAGDNADWGDGDAANKLYYQEIDYIAGLDISVDIAFIPVCTYSGMRPADMTKGAFYAIDRLDPAVTYPMHANGRERLYKEFAYDLQLSGRNNKIICVE